MNLCVCVYVQTQMHFQGQKERAVELEQNFSLSSWRHAAAAAVVLLQSCLTLCDPIDSSPSGSPIPGILQARTLELVAISFSRGSS